METRSSVAQSVSVQSIITQISLTNAVGVSSNSADAGFLLQPYVGMSLSNLWMFPGFHRTLPFAFPQ